jgi:hypothetical protein
MNHSPLVQIHFKIPLFDSENKKNECTVGVTIFWRADLQAIYYNIWAIGFISVTEAVPVAWG